MTELTSQSQILKARYHEMGWWTGELLPDRYAHMSRMREKEPAVVDNRGRQLSHDELSVGASEFSELLLDQGVVSGSRVILFAPNWAEWMIAFLGILQARCVPVPVPITTDANTLTRMIDLVQPSVVVSGSEYHEMPLAKTAASVCMEAEVKPGLLILEYDGQFAWCSNPTEQQTDLLPGLDDVQQIIHQLGFTSGTTGKPKAVVHTSDTLTALHIGFSERFSLNSQTPIFMPSQLGHSVGAYHGARLSLFNASPLVLQDIWNPEEAIALMAEHRCHFTAAATPFLRDLLECEDFSAQHLPTLRYFLCGGAPVPPILIEQASEQFVEALFTNLWGMTEGGLVTCSDACPQKKVLTTSGMGLPGLELRIIDTEGNHCASDQEGELVMRGPGVFVGYYGQQDLYASLLTEDGFFRTEDLARLDHEGYLQITGRLKDLIIRGGVNISPIPIEDVLARHPTVASIAVIGVPDERLGERIGAVVVLRGNTLSLKELNEFAEQIGLAKRYQPEVLYLVDEMPRTASGKISKADLRQRFAKQEMFRGFNATTT